MNANDRSDGGPAFPKVYDTYSEGMSLRDWFAGQAIAGRLAYGSHTSSLRFEEIARECYDQADAMLQERVKP